MSTTSFRIDDELEEKLNDIAQKLKRSKSWIINDALKTYIQQEERKQKMLRDTEEAIADIEADRIVSGKEVMEWLESWGTQNEKEAPSK